MSVDDNESFFFSRFNLFLFWFRMLFDILSLWSTLEKWEIIKNLKNIDKQLTSMSIAFLGPSGQPDFLGISWAPLCDSEDSRLGGCHRNYIPSAVPSTRSPLRLILLETAKHSLDASWPSHEECPRERQPARRSSASSCTHATATHESLLAGSPTAFSTTESFPTWGRSRACRSCSKAGCREAPPAPPIRCREFDWKFPTCGPAPTALSPWAASGTPDRGSGSSRSVRPSEMSERQKIIQVAGGWEELTWCLWLQCWQCCDTNGPVGIPNFTDLGLSGAFLRMAKGCRVMASQPVHWKIIDCFLWKVCTIRNYIKLTVK